MGTAAPIIDSQARLTGSQINYYFVCKRKLWLFSHNIELESESDLVKLGRLLHENRYKRRLKEVQVDRIKVDFMEAKKGLESRMENNALTDPFMIHTSSQGEATKNIEQEEIPTKELVIHEVKRSKKMQDAHLNQLLYYMYYLKKNYAVNILKGILHYPLLNKNVEVLLTEERVKQIEEAILGVAQVNAMPRPPEATWKGYCRSCAYSDLCWG